MQENIKREERITKNWSSGNWKCRGFSLDKFSRDGRQPDYGDKNSNDAKSESVEIRKNLAFLLISKHYWLLMQLMRVKRYSLKIIIAFIFWWALSFLFEIISQSDTDVNFRKPCDVTAVSWQRRDVELNIFVSASSRFFWCNMKADAPVTHGQSWSYPCQFGFVDFKSRATQV